MKLYSNTQVRGCSSIDDAGVSKGSKDGYSIPINLTERATSKGHTPSLSDEGYNTKGHSRFDTSVGRGDTTTVIGAGRLLKGGCSFLYRSDMLEDAEC